MYDNPISWGVLCVLAICAMIWFWKKCEEEISQNQKEEEEYWKKWEK